MLRLLQSKKFKIFVFLFLLALLARLFFFGSMLSHYGPGSFYLANSGAPLTVNDSMNYVVIAKNLVERGAYSRFVDPPYDPDSFRTPLLPLYFVPFVYFFGVGGITLAVLLLTVIVSFTGVAAYSLARLFLSYTLSVWAGVLVAVEPLLAYRSNIAEPDALIVLLLTVALYYFVLYWRDRKPRYLYLTFILLSLLTLAKPLGAGLLALLLSASIVVWMVKKTPCAQTARLIGVSVCIVVLLLGPWLYRNERVFGVWGLSSVGAYNLYNYYTASLAPDNESLPQYARVDQDPLRNLANAHELTRIAVGRIAQNPDGYVRLHLLGIVRNVLASDLPAFYHHKQLKLLPFAYDPVNQVNLSDVALKGDLKALVRIVLTADNVGFVARHVFFILFYLLVIVAWIKSYRAHRKTFWSFTLFLVLTCYFIFTAGTFVDAKYRLPAVSLLVIMFLYFFDRTGEGVQKEFALYPHIT